jgi:hypothetical protein
VTFEERKHVFRKIKSKYGDDCLLDCLKLGRLLHLGPSLCSYNKNYRLGSRYIDERSQCFMQNTAQYSQNQTQGQIHLHHLLHSQNMYPSNHSEGKEHDIPGEVELKNGEANLNSTFF